QFGAAGKGGIGVENVTRGVLVEDAAARQFVAGIVHRLEIVEDLAARLVGLAERDVVVEVEVAAERRHPLELPAHALVVGGDLGVGRARHGDVHDVVVDEMHHRALDLVGAERAAETTLLPVGTQHEMVDDQLAAAGEQIAQRLLAVGSFEDVGLVDLDPGQLARLLAQLVLGAQQLLFLGQQVAAGGNPFVAGDGFVCLHDSLSFQAASGRLSTALNTVCGTAKRGSAYSARSSSKRRSGSCVSPASRSNSAKSSSASSRFM